MCNGGITMPKVAFSNMALTLKSINKNDNPIKQQRFLQTLMVATHWFRLG
jgi:hypothetical protein